jgi:hypothetical protein
MQLAQMAKSNIAMNMHLDFSAYTQWMLGLFDITQKTVDIPHPEFNPYNQSIPKNSTDPDLRKDPIQLKFGEKKILGRQKERHDLEQTDPQYIHDIDITNIDKLDDLPIQFALDLQNMNPASVAFAQEIFGREYMYTHNFANAHDVMLTDSTYVELEDEYGNLYK